MRDTRRTLLISGGLSLAGAAMIAFGATVFESQGESLPTVGLIAVGFAIAPIAIIWFLSAAISGLRKEALESGKGEIARWRLTAAEWNAFRAQEKRMIAEGRPVSLLNFRSGEAQDADVVFAQRGVIADEDYHDLIPGGLMDLRDVENISGSPSCLEFSLRAQNSRGASGLGVGFTYATLRIPIAPGDRRAAIQVYAHYKRITRRGPAIALINPKLTLRICLGLAAVCAIAAVWGFANRESRAYGDAPLYAAVIGVVLGGGALLLAAIVRDRVRGIK